MSVADDEEDGWLAPERFNVDRMGFSEPIHEVRFSIMPRGSDELLEQAFDLDCNADAVIFSAGEVVVVVALTPDAEREVNRVATQMTGAPPKRPVWLAIANGRWHRHVIRNCGFRTKSAPIPDTVSVEKRQDRLYVLRRVPPATE